MLFKNHTLSSNLIPLLKHIFVKAVMSCEFDITINWPDVHKTVFLDVFIFKNTIYAKCMYFFTECSTYYPLQTKQPDTVQPERY